MASHTIDNKFSINDGGTIVESNVAQVLINEPPVITKAVDKTQATVGDILTYTITIENTMAVDRPKAEFSDALPDGVEYVSGSFTYNGAAATPVVLGKNIKYDIAVLGASAKETISFQVKAVGGTI